MSEYGPGIATHGARPDFVRDDDLVWALYGNRNRFCDSIAAKGISWPLVTAIRLRADHPYYLVAKHPGMVMHLGGTRPADYDGSRGVLFRRGTVHHWSSYDWRWDERAGGAIIGYYPLPPAVPQQPDIPQWAKDRARELANAGADSDIDAFARYVAEHEPEPVDEATALWLHLCDVAGRNLRDNGDPLEPIALLRAHLAKVRGE